MKEVEVVLSMPLFHHRKVRKNSIVVVISVMHTTTSIIAALDHGVKSIIPVSSEAEAEVMKEDGYILAAEPSGNPELSDIGITSGCFNNSDLKGKEVVFQTADGTKAFRLTREEADKVLIGAFPNLSALANVLIKQSKNVVLVCAGKAGLPSIQDQVFAGALARKMMDSKMFASKCDSVLASIDIWNTAQKDLKDYLRKSKKLTVDYNLLTSEELSYALTPDSSSTIPILHFNHILPMKA